MYNIFLRCIAVKSDTTHLLRLFNIYFIERVLILRDYQHCCNLHKEGIAIYKTFRIDKCNDKVRH